MDHFRKRLRSSKCITTSTRMVTRRQWRRFIDSPAVEWTLFVVGLLLLIVSPLVGAIPGPGGIIVAGIGLALVLKTSMWAKRRYVKFKRWQPKAGRLADRALRRRSAKRREALRSAAESGSGN
ncbi:MAG: hypothetical protein ACJ8FO_01385 [Sphingomicrobium sp.]